MRRLPWLWALGLLLLAPAAWAGPIERDEIPEALRPWVKWVLHGSEQIRCPFLTGSRAQGNCAWPGRLELDLDGQGGKFSQTWTLYAPGYAFLPGDEKLWPQALLVDGRPQAAVAQGGRPALFLEPGTYRVSGSFLWNHLPESLPIPEGTGIVSLRLKGQAVSFPNRDEDGRLYLQRAAEAAAEEERLEIHVSRRVEDSVPLILETRLELAVSGKAREVVLARAFPEKFVPLSLEGPLAARLEPDGRLRVQARPGRWTLSLSARHEGPVSELALAPPKGIWAEEEVWVFDARPQLRVADVEGVPSVDPQQTLLPEEWKSFPAYRMAPGDTMKLAERRRGDADPQPDRLQLNRLIWLDFSGRGYSVQDTLWGTLSRGWRLEMSPPSTLERVVVSGADQVITKREGSEAQGIEVRQGQILLASESRVEGRSSFSAVGWDHDFQKVQAVLNLPPGWRALAAFGVDKAPGTWAGRWTLLDFFLVLVIALAFRRLWGNAWGALALVGLALIYHERDAPMWIFLAVLAPEALLRLIENEKAQRWTRAWLYGATGVLVLLCVPFMLHQIRVGMYPVLEYPDAKVGEGRGSEDDITNLASLGMFSRSEDYSSFPGILPGILGSRMPDSRAEDQMAANAPAAAEPLMEAASESPAQIFEAEKEAEEAKPQARRMMVPSKLKKARGKMEEISGGALLLGDGANQNLQKIDPTAIVNTGAGLPRWRWNQIPLQWSGPVEKSQRLRLLLLSPFENFLLALARVALLSLLVLRILGLPGKFWPKLPRGGPATASAAAAILAAFLLAPPAALAQMPSPELLNDLRQKLLEKPPCYADCAEASRLFLEYSPENLRGRLEVGAAAQTAVALPGNSRQWAPSQVLVDGRAAAGPLRGENGELWVVVEKGRHEILFEGPLPSRESIQIPLPMKPHRVEARGSGWLVAGIHDDGVPDESLSLSRVAGQGAGKEGALSAANLPPFLEVERTLVLGLTWRVETRVRRRSPYGAPVTAQIPLLAGESVTTEGIRVEKAKALVSLAPQAEEVSWSSELKTAGRIALEAPATLAWAEVWRLDASPLWHVERSGIPPVHAEGEPGVRVPEWRPWPGEKLDLDISRPAGVAGQSLTVDRSVLTVTPGLRSTEAALNLSIRSSRGGRHTVTLPEGAELESLAIDGGAQPIRQEGRQVTFPVSPGGEQVVIAWREKRGVSGFFRSSDVDLGLPSVNPQVIVKLPEGRWVLFAWGPRLGPAVLFWSLLAVIALVSVGLGRIPWSPLAPTQWGLLGVGLSQVPLPAAALVAGWLLALGLRRERGGKIESGGVFNLLQLVLALWSFAALLTLLWSIQQGLLGSPEMQVIGNGSSPGELRWFLDRTGEKLPSAWALSAPLLAYRLAMLAWALWLALSLLKWLRWGWESFTAGGGWRKHEPKAKTLGADVG